MQCDEFEHRLQRLLDRRALPETDRWLVEHSRECASCRRVLETQQKLFAALRAPLRPRCSPEVSHRAVTEFIRGRRRQRLRVAIAIGVAAALLIACLPGWRRDGAEFQGVRLRQANVVAMTQAPRMPQAEGPPSRAEAEEIRELLQQLMSSWNEGLLSDSVTPLAGTFRPLTTTLSAALDALWRTIPGYRAPEAEQPQARLPTSPVVS